MADVVVLGGGFGGLAAATRLGRAVAGRHAVTLVDRSDTFMMGLAKLWILAGLREPGAGAGLRTRLAAPGVAFRQASVRRIDPAARRVETDAGDLRYDHLLVALGAETSPGAVPGLRPEDNLYDPAMVTGLRDRLAGLARGRVAVAICSSPYKCPPAPFEAALLAEHLLRSRGRAGAVTITVYVPEARPMMVAGPAAGALVVRTLADRGIAVKVEHRLERVDHAGRTLAFANGAAEPFDLLLAIPPHTVPAVVREAGLAGPTGWIPVDPRTLATGIPGVHAVGDVTSLALPGGGFLPKAGVLAEWQALLVADRILAELGEPVTPAEFDGRGECWFETGDGAAMIARGSFFNDPASRVAFTEPSAEGLRLKHEFERTRLAEWFA